MAFLSKADIIFIDGYRSALDNPAVYQCNLPNSNWDDIRIAFADVCFKFISVQLQFAVIRYEITLQISMRFSYLLFRYVSLVCGMCSGILLSWCAWLFVSALTTFIYPSRLRCTPNITTTNKTKQTMHELSVIATP